jgi:hypothetical protein
MLFGSSKFSLPTNFEALASAAKKILESRINPATFDHRVFLKQATDVIAIERTISRKMRKLWIADSSE